MIHTTATALVRNLVWTIKAFTRPTMKSNRGTACTSTFVQWKYLYFSNPPEWWEGIRLNSNSSVSRSSVHTHKEVREGRRGALQMHPDGAHSVLCRLAVSRLAHQRAAAAATLLVASLGARITIYLERYAPFSKAYRAKYDVAMAAQHTTSCLWMSTR